MQSVFAQALDFIEHNKSDFGIRRTKRLPVSGAFHTDLMKPAVQIFKEALKDVAVERPRVPVFSNFNNQAGSLIQFTGFIG